MAKREKEKALAPAELARARAELSDARGRRRLDVILDARDPQALVRALPADEVYLLVREVGLADAAELVRLASPEQFKTFLDLDAWSRDRLDPRRVLPWLRAARAGALGEPKAAARWGLKLAALDPELLLLVLRTSLRVHDLEANPDPEITSDRFMRTPEGKLLIEFRVEGAEYAAVRGILDDLFADDPFRTTRLLSALGSEAESELEESALRWRTGRLADLGFPSLDEALSWFARPPLGQALPPGPPARPSGFFLAQFRRGSLLDRAAARLDLEWRDALDHQVLAAANAVLVADGVDPGDLAAVRSAVEAARAMVEMGLEQVAGGEEERAAEALREVAVKRLFQEGFGRVLALKWRAERVLKAGGAGTREAPLLDPPLGEAVAALAARRPRYDPGLEADAAEWGTPASAASEPRPFLSSAELGRAAAALDVAEELAGIARRLGLVPTATTPGPLAPRLSALYLTALANERLGRAFAPTPIAADELRAAAEALSTIGEDARLGDGAAGKLLLEMARRRAEELATLREGGKVRPEALTGLVVDR
jgi:hypothetical protein